MLNARMRSNPVSWDVLHTQDWANTYAINGMQSWLLIHDPYDASRLVPDVAERWTVSDDGKVYTFALKRGVRWHDGAPLTARDVAYNLNLAVSPPEPARNYMQAKLGGLIAQVEQPDELTVRITAKRVSAALLESLAQAQMALYPSHKGKDELKDSAFIGSGPFKMVSYAKDSEMKTARDPNFYGKDSRGGQLPYLDGVQWFLMNGELAFSAFRSGKTDTTAHDADWAYAQQDTVRRSLPDARFDPWITNRQDVLFNQKPPFTDQRVRAAFSLAYDRQAHDDVVNRGGGIPLASPMLPASRGGIWALPTEEMAQRPGFRADRKAEDRARAQQLLKEAGVDPKALTINLLGSSFFNIVGESMASRLREDLGVNVRLRLEPPAQNTSSLTTGDYDLTHLSASIVTDEPLEMIGTFVRIGGGRNYSKWSDPQIDALLDQQDGTLDPVRRKAIIQDLQRQALDRAFTIPITWTPVVAIARGYVKNQGDQLTAFHPAAWFRWDQVWLDR